MAITDKTMKKVKVKISWLDNYGAYSDEIPGCIATHKTLEGVKEAFNSALQFHIEGIIECGEELPKCLNGDYEIVFELNAQALLHHFEGILTRSALSRVTGINERQLGHYATGHRTPRSAQRNKIIEGIRKIGKEFISVK